MTKLDEVLARVKAIDQAANSERFDELRIAAVKSFSLLDGLLCKVFNASDEDLLSRKGAPSPSDYNEGFAGVTKYGIELYTPFKSDSSVSSKEKVRDIDIVATLVTDSFMTKYPEYKFEPSVKQTGGFFILVSPKPPTPEWKIRTFFKFMFNPFFRWQLISDHGKPKV